MQRVENARISRHVDQSFIWKPHLNGKSTVQNPTVISRHVDQLKTSDHLGNPFITQVPTQNDIIDLLSMSRHDNETVND